MLFTGKDDHLRKPGQQTESSPIYRGNRFTIGFPEGWQDRTVYTLMGPVEGGVQHNILITVEEAVPFDSVLEYADLQITALEEQLKGYHLLKREEISLASGLPAYRVVYRWYPTDQLRVYQEQIFILVDTTGYKLTTTFTKKTRKTLGPKVERILMSFRPEKEPVRQRSE